jgi:hypothetical protein
VWNAAPSPFIMKELRPWPSSLLARGWAQRQEIWAITPPKAGNKKYPAGENFTPVDKFETLFRVHEEGARFTTAAFP